MSLDLLWLVLGGIASLVITVLKRFIPPFGVWFDAQISDESRQALMLWVGVGVVAIRCGVDLWGTALPSEPGALASLLWQCFTGVILSWQGAQGTFGATKHVFGTAPRAYTGGGIVELSQSPSYDEAGQG